jgi:hypothetical protein
MQSAAGLNIERHLGRPRGANLMDETLETVPPAQHKNRFNRSGFCVVSLNQTQTV